MTCRQILQLRQVPDHDINLGKQIMMVYGFLSRLWSRSKLHEKVLLKLKDLRMQD